MVEIKINFQKKHLIFLILVVGVAGLGFVIAQGVGSVSHGADQIDLGGGVSLASVLGSISSTTEICTSELGACDNSDAGGIAGYENKTCETEVANEVTCGCPAGKVLIGGGGQCGSGSIRKSAPTNNTQWKTWCTGGNQFVRSYIMCANV